MTIRPSRLRWYKPPSQSFPRRVPRLAFCTSCNQYRRQLFHKWRRDFSLEILDLIHRIYDADESFHSLDFMVHTKLYIPHIVVQILVGTILPLLLLASTQVIKLQEVVRKWIYSIAGTPSLIGIFALRWNVVIGGQLFSKSFLG